MLIIISAPSRNTGKLSPVTGFAGFFRKRLHLSRKRFRPPRNCQFRALKPISINKNRPITADAASAGEILEEIERKSRIKATGIVNNTHLMGFTTEETVLSSMEYARQTAADMNLPLRFTTAPESFADKLDIENIYYLGYNLY